ncbi:MAG: hypothetical protein FWE12_08945, partial [Oscillospiraceae bacterium]|nr:hypothetical protein [Oscillospiraceae bacterium]
MAREIDFMSQYGFLTYAAIFLWPAVGSAITEERSKPVENDALSKAGTKINQIIRELRATADH